MLCSLDFLRGVGQGTEGERRAGLLQRQGLAAAQLQNSLLGFQMQAALLRH